MANIKVRDGDNTEKFLKATGAGTDLDPFVKHVQLDPSTNNIGDVDVLTLPALPSGSNVIGGVTQSGTWNIGSITTLPSLPAGTNNIGDVDVLTLPVAFSSGTVNATTQRVTIATNDGLFTRLGTNGDAANLTGSQSAQLRAIGNSLSWVSLPLTTSTSGYTPTNGSSKYWEVPSGKEWQILSIGIDFVTTATVGNRQISVRLTDSSGTIFLRLPAGTTQAASLTRRYQYGIGLPDLTAFRNTDVLETPLSPIVLPAGYRIQILDTAAIDATNDAITPRGFVLERSV